MRTAAQPGARKGPKLAAVLGLLAGIAGGRAAADPAAAADADEVFVTLLPAYVVALDGWASERSTSAERVLGDSRAALLSPSSRAALGDDAFSALERLAASAQAAAETRSSRLDAAADQLAKRARALDEALAAANVPYAVDTEVIATGSDRSVLVFSFAVQGLTRYRSGKTELRARRVSRADRLNWSYRLFGFTGSRRRDVTVLMDSIDERVIGTLLPALGERHEKVVDLGPEVESQAWATKLEQIARDIVRTDLPAAAGLSLTALATRLDARVALFDKLNGALAARGVELERPLTLALPEGYEEELTEAVDAADLARLEAIERELSSAASRRALAAARNPIARSVELHEIQHKLDLSGKLPMPRSLARLTGPARDRRGKDRALAVTARAELSAYLAELARSDVPRIVLVQLATFAVDERSWGLPESYVAVAILDELAGDLEIAAEPLVLDGVIQRERVALRFAAVAARTPTELSAAAARAWEKLFRRKLPAVIALPDPG